MPLYQQPILWAEYRSYRSIIHHSGSFSVTELQKMRDLYFFRFSAKPKTADISHPKAITVRSVFRPGLPSRSKAKEYSPNRLTGIAQPYKTRCSFLLFSFSINASLPSRHGFVFILSRVYVQINALYPLRCVCRCDISAKIFRFSCRADYVILGNKEPAPVQYS